MKRLTDRRKRLLLNGITLIALASLLVLFAAHLRTVRSTLEAYPRWLFSGLSETEEPALFWHLVRDASEADNPGPQGAGDGTRSHCFETTIRLPDTGLSTVREISGADPSCAPLLALQNQANIPSRLSSFFLALRYRVVDATLVLMSAKPLEDTDAALRRLAVRLASSPCSKHQHTSSGSGLGAIVLDLSTCEQGAARGLLVHVPLPASNLTANLLLLNMILSGAAAFVLFRYALVERFPFSLLLASSQLVVAFAYGLLTWAAVNNSPPSTSMLVWIGLLPSNGLCLAAALALLRRSSLSLRLLLPALILPSLISAIDLVLGFPLFDPIVSTISVAAVGFAAFRVTRSFFRLSPRDDFAPRPTTLGVYLLASWVPWSLLQLLRIQLWGVPLSETVLPAPLATAGDYSLFLLLLYAKALALLVAILFVASCQAFQLRYRPDEIYLAIRRGLVESSSGSVDGGSVASADAFVKQPLSELLLDRRDSSDIRQMLETTDGTVRRVVRLRAPHPNGLFSLTISAGDVLGSRDVWLRRVASAPLQSLVCNVLLGQLQLLESSGSAPHEISTLGRRLLALVSAEAFDSGSLSCQLVEALERLDIAAVPSGISASDTLLCSPQALQFIDSALRLALALEGQATGAPHAQLSQQVGSRRRVTIRWLLPSSGRFRAFREWATDIVPPRIVAATDPSAALVQAARYVAHLFGADLSAGSSHLELSALVVASQRRWGG